MISLASELKMLDQIPENFLSHSQILVSYF